MQCYKWFGKYSTIGQNSHQFLTGIRIMLITGLLALKESDMASQMNCHIALKF